MVGDAEIRHHFERALLGRGSVKNTQDLGTIERALGNEYNLLSSADANSASVSNMMPSMVGAGCDYTFGVGNTLAYMNRDYGLNIKSGVQSGDTNCPVDRRAKSELVQTFVKHTSVLDTQKLVKIM